MSVIKKAIILSVTLLFAGAVGNAVIVRAIKWYRSRNRVGIAITSNDNSISYLNHWLIENNLLRDAASVETKLEHSSRENIRNRGRRARRSAEGEGLVTKGDTQLIATLPNGITYLTIKNIRIRFKKTSQISLFNDIVETIEISASSNDVNRMFLEQIIEEARCLSETRHDKKIIIYKPDSRYWTISGSRNKRTLESVVLKDGVAESLCEDLKDFVDSKDWYKQRGIPYRRGYILYGPAGCGKTSIISAMASKLNFAVCVLNLKANINDDTLDYLLTHVPRKSLLLLEDIDCVLTSREPIRDKNGLVTGNSGMIEASTKVTFSGLLNAIDGFELSEGRILFMTTNYIDKLDKALWRPGRIDKVQLIDYPCKEQAMKVCARFYPEASREQIEEFGIKFAAMNCRLSVAALQGMFLINKHDISSAMKCLHEDEHQIITELKNKGNASIYM